MDESIRVLRVAAAGDGGRIESLERADDRVAVATATGAGEALDRVDRGTWTASCPTTTSPT